MKFKFSIIIIYSEISSDLYKCLNHIDNQNYKNFEVILVSEQDKKIEHKFNFSYKRIISQDKSPSFKRNLGVKNSDSNYIAFIDDDAYANKNWLEMASFYFHKGYEIFGGSAVNDKEESHYNILNSVVYLDIFNSGVLNRYEDTKNIRFIDEMPSVNFFVKREIFNLVNGFDNNFWPGEDSLICNEILKKGYKIYYVPNLLVEHQRRKGFIKTQQQISKYSYTRGFIIRNKNPYKIYIQYFIPSLFLIYLIFLLSTYFIFGNLNLYLSTPFYIYIFYTFTNTIINIYKYKSLLLILTPIFLFISHLNYGFGFLRGFFSKKYKLKLGR